LIALLPSKVILPTLTFGPSFTANVSPTDAGGIGALGSDGRKLAVVGG
jgi:hypothetical protein